ncbi:amino acid ABC transporter substrate-binding protein [Streptomyces alfalfae]|uniref:Amino acid ABC transporter substrate-binding protein n=1 Tax=Streptomyces alfalfae TaxID=1642299 RepID=A0ABM6GTC6_9ACTN|nr:ABC transporter substrate-binding protein [Streptomyces alfalfae]AYA17472.1 ABC transporter substrate-binding protein [Streptomyces fradiae]APY87075.1 amino acid ABC transporter substrate-binding protein [Streptomyces alfalfae]QUI33143.1 ABC transporter substrate-binding protein [Streptomyces alfalfae]RXX44483.1 amino acid ABC transporter substrate-binding protein [Streptomyces alfalfae]RZM92275.1 ABC transporter substrate-binding protein [Streptomyces alfalfae]
MNSTTRRARRMAGAAAAVMALTAGLAACGGDSLEDDGKGSDKGGGGKKGSIVVGSARFTEQKVLAELYAGVLADAGYDTQVKTVQNREIYKPELKKGTIDVAPEYAATLAEFLNLQKNGPKAEPVASSDLDATVSALEKLAEPEGLKALPAGEAVDQNAFAVSAEFAKEHKLKTLSDLGRSGEKVKIAAGDECESRPFCAPGLKKKYGIDVAGIDPKGVGTTQSKQAVKNGTDQLVLTTTTDATLKNYDLVILEDDKKLQNADNILPVVNAEEAGSKEIADALAKITKTLTTDDLIELNRKVDEERQKEADVAKEYLESKGLI